MNLCTSSPQPARTGGLVSRGSLSEEWASPSASRSWPNAPLALARLAPRQLIPHLVHRKCGRVVTQGLAFFCFCFSTGRVTVSSYSSHTFPHCIHWGDSGGIQKEGKGATGGEQVAQAWTSPGGCLQEGKGASQQAPTACTPLYHWVYRGGSSLVPLCLFLILSRLQEQLASSLGDTSSVFLCSGSAKRLSAPVQSTESYPRLQNSRQKLESSQERTQKVPLLPSSGHWGFRRPDRLTPHSFLLPISPSAASV